MTPDAKTAFIEQVKRERADLVRRIAQYDAVLTTLATLYPDEVADTDKTVASGTDEPAPVSVSGQDQHAGDLMAGTAGRRTYGRGTTNNLIVQILKTAEGAWLSADVIADEAFAQGWGLDLPDRVSAVRTACRRLADKDVIYRRKDGRGYVYRTPTNAESPAATGLSVVPAPTSDEGRTADVEGIGDRDDHLSGRNDDHGRGAPSVVEG